MSYLFHTPQEMSDEAEAIYESENGLDKETRLSRSLSIKTGKGVKMNINDKGLNRFLGWNKEGIGLYTYEHARLCQYALKNTNSVVTMSKKVAFIFKRYGYKIKKLDKGFLIIKKLVDTQDVIKEK